MIYTVTFNPAIDYVVHAERFELGNVNRSSREEMFFGGKGINVSVILNELGIKSVALGFTAGFTGEAIEDGVAAMGIRSDFIRLKNGNSRINVKIKSGIETELNGCGPDIDEEAIGRLYDKLDRLEDGDMIVLAGSIPGSVPADIYERILARLYGKNIRAVVDASGRLLLNVLKYKPFLVKPNDIELGEMFGVRLSSEDDIAEYACRLRDMGARNVLVSRAGDGAMLIAENGERFTRGVCNGTVRNSVGAGDSMVAGFIAGLMSSEANSSVPDYEYALSLGTAAGGATAFSEGLAGKEFIYELLEQLG